MVLPLRHHRTIMFNLHALSQSQSRLGSMNYVPIQLSYHLREKLALKSIQE